MCGRQHSTIGLREPCSGEQKKMSYKDNLVFFQLLPGQNKNC